MTRERRVGLALGLGILGAVLSACSSVPKDKYDAAMQENAELRDQVAMMDSTIREYDDRNAELTAENAALAQENDRLRSEGPAGGGIDWGDNVDASMRGNEVVLNIAGDVLFDSGSAALKTSAKRSLDQVARQLQANYPNNMIRVEGYTDTDPIRKSKWKTNRRLSVERAMSVEEYLVERGVDNARIYSAGFGETRPKATKSASRRVEIVILAGTQ